MARELCRDGDNRIVASDSNPSLIAVSWSCDARLKMIVRRGTDVPYYYDIPSDGTKTVVPLCAGNGRYGLDLLKSVKGSWVTIAAVTYRLSASDRALGYTCLASSGWCTWSANGPCRGMAMSILADKSSKRGDTSYRVTDIVNEVIACMRKMVKYDERKADSLRGGHGYVPDPDRTLREGRGICSDIASVMVAVLRCIGIPSRLVAGYLLPEKISHAWVEVLIDGKWVTYDPTALMRTTKIASKKQHGYQTVCIW